jgi:hypothetical protein
MVNPVTNLKWPVDQHSQRAEDIRNRVFGGKSEGKTTDTETARILSIRPQKYQRQTPDQKKSPWS